MAAWYCVWNAACTEASNTHLADPALKTLIAWALRDEALFGLMLFMVIVVHLFLWIEFIEL